MTTSKAPVSFWIITIIMVLWNLMGVFSFFFHTMIGEEQLAAMDPAEAALYDQYPMWINVMFAIAVFGGTVGCIGLLMRKAWSKMAFQISLVGIIIQFTHNMFFTDTIAVYGPTSWIMPILVTLIGIFLIWFSNKNIQAGILS